MSSVDPQPSSVPDQATLDVANDPASIDAVQGMIVAVIERHNYPKASIFAIKLSLHEAISNAFRHGHANLAPDLSVMVSYAVDERRILLAVQDQGPGFNPSSVPDPTLEENLERGSGRGLLLIRAYMASVRYNASGNRLEMVYERPSA